MNDLNNVVVEGNLVDDPELKALSSGAVLANFTFGNNRSRKVEGEWEQESSFFDAVAFGKTAELLAEHAKKGYKVRVTGRLQQDRWEHEGKKRSRVKVVAAVVEWQKPKGEGGKPSRSTPPADGFEDDIPF